ncbi:MAG: urea carboxylase-associated family protein [Defluviicoccus sp.]|nr:urea carboxylase-associated family protein [Defluviicoccus sp.]MDE0385999.1 urea carboxylase-associated family protein [Defluviicoccus sp.]
MGTDVITVPGTVIEDRLVEPRGHHACEVSKGEVYRIVDVEGQQVADFLCFNLHRLEEKLSPHNTLLLNNQVFPGVGYTLFSDEAGALMTMTADTNGTHDIIAGACSRFTNQYRYGVEGTPNCRDNFAAALAPWGIEWKQIPYNINVFMNCPIQPDGTFTIELPSSKAGDYVDFTAETDVLVAMSNCPQERNKCNAFNPTPMRAIHYRPG